MPYCPSHKSKTKEHIVETARILFNREGFSQVSIDRIMNEAGLTRGGFYHHFRNKDELYAEAVSSFLNGRGKEWRDEAGIDPKGCTIKAVYAMLDSYLSSDHLGDLDGQCPMIALPSDVARASPTVRKAYSDLLRAMTWLFENNMADCRSGKDTALALSAMCVGGMVLARTVDDSELADQIRSAAKAFAIQGIEGNSTT